MRHRIKVRFRAVKAARGRVQRPLEVGKSGRSIRPVSDEADLRGGHEGLRRHGRRERFESEDCRRHRCACAANGACVALELHELVEVRQRRCVTAVIGRSDFMLTSGQAHLMMMLPSGCVLVCLVWLGNRSRHHPVVVRAAIEHRRSSKALERQCEQQQPHHCGAETGHHGESAEGFC